MAKSNYLPYAFIRGKTCKIEQAVVPIQCKAIQYGLGCFSGIRGFWNPKKKNLYLFRFDEHYKRFAESAKILGMKLNYSWPEFQKIVLDLVKKNKVKEDVYIRPTLYSGSLKLTPRFDDNEADDVAIYMMSLKDYFPGNKGLNVCVSSWRRINDDVISTKAKSTGAYAASALAKTEAIKNGYDEPIFLNRDGNVCEASGANIFGVKNGVLWTPPLSSNILDGITRRSLLTLCREKLNIVVREENFDRSMLYAMDELFFTGTAAKLTFISHVDKRPIGKGETGPMVKKLNEAFDKVVVGEMEGYEKWCTAVY